MLRQAGRLAVAFIVVVSAIACTDDGGGSTPAANALPDGWTIPDGAELVGTVIPELGEERSSNGRRQRQWYAVLRVAGRPARVYRALNEQVAARRMPAMGLEPNACLAVPMGEFRCAGSSIASDGGSALDVCVARPYGIVSFRKNVERAPSATTKRLLASEQIGQRDRDWPVLAGTRRLIPRSQVRSCGVPDLLEVTGTPDRVWDEFVDDARKTESATQIAARRYGLDVTEIVAGGYDYDIRVTRVVPPEGPSVIAAIASS